MLEILRKSVSGWVAKIFIAMLVVSFAIWGIEDIFTRSATSTVATVGDTDIPTEQFRYSFQEEMQRVGRQMGRGLSLDQARSLGIDQQVLGRLLTNATLDIAIRDLNVSVTDQAIARAIVEEPTFQDASGNFNRAYFDQVLRSSGMNEPAFVAEQKRAHTRHQITASVTGAPPAPRVLVDALYRFQEETRTIAYVTLTDTMLGSLPEPDEPTLRAHFEANRSAFAAPEYRRVEMLTLMPAEMAKTVEVPEDAIRELYEQRKARLGTPERREVQQILFASADGAAQAAERLAQGADFATIGSERGLSESDMALGLVAPGDIADPAIREAAFALAEGAVSAPVAGTFGTALVRVARIEPGSGMTYEQARDELRQEIALYRAGDRIFDLHDTIEDERAAGSTFQEISRKLDVPLRVIEAVDASGRGPDGAQLDIPGDAQTVRLAFQIDPGIEADPIDMGQNGQIWVDVASVTPARERSFEEVRALVAADWRETQLRERLAERSRRMQERLQAGTPLADIAAELGSELRTAGPLKRMDRHDELSPAAIQAAFAAPVHGVAVSRHQDGQSHILLQVQSSEAPAPSSEQARQLRDAIGESFANTLLVQYIAAEQDAHGLIINERALQSVFGSSDP